MKTTANKVNTGVNNLSSAIIAELDTRKDRSAWNKGVTEYATELAESLDNWDKQPESVAELREMMLDGVAVVGSYRSFPKCTARVDYSDAKKIKKHISGLKTRRGKISAAIRLIKRYAR